MSNTSPSTVTPPIPKTMKAAVMHKFMAKGDYLFNVALTSKTISVENDVPVPEPRKGEVLVQVAAAAINPVDWKLLKGDFPGKGPGDGFGLDVSGVVAKLGPEPSDRFSLGDPIYADAIATSKRSGTFGQYCIVQEVAASAKPKNVDFVQAASLPLAGLTALQGLIEHGRLQKGDKVLILGGSGGVGSLAIQIAKGLGASEVYSTGSSTEMISDLGADQVINYKEVNVMDAVKDKEFDIVYDTIGGVEHWKIGKSCLRKGGTYVTIVGDGPKVSLPMVFAKTMWRKFVSVFGFGPSYKIFLTSTRAPGVVTDMKILTDLVEAKKVKPVLYDQSFELTTESLHDMIQASMTHKAKGKLVMKVDV